MKKSLIVVFIVLASTLAFAQSRPEWRSWNRPVEPFRIGGNIYYVGASDIASYLITSPSGHIVIDGGFEETAPQIETNIRKLGFRVRDVRILLNSHAHFDHAAGLAELKRATGAKLLISREDAPLIEHGGRDDFAWGDSLLFPAAHVDGFVADGEHVRVGTTDLVAHLTPGHTKGCTTWTTTVSEDGKRYDVTFLCSVSVPGYKLVNNSAYPNIVSDYRHSFATLKQLHTDIFLASHGGFFHLAEKRADMGPGKPNPFIVPGEWQQFLKQAQSQFDSDLQSQQSGSVK